MKWLEISVETEAAAAETVSAILQDYGDGGVAIYQHAVPDGADGSYRYHTTRTVILAIAAARLGARRVIAVDSSEIAVAAARENVARNGLSSVIHVLHGERVLGTAEQDAAPQTTPHEAGAPAPASSWPAAYDL